MRFATTLAVVAACVLVAVTEPSLVSSVAARGDPVDRFDSYILAQFWQPAECEGAPRRYRGCYSPKNLYMANSLTLHGLWPEWDRKRNSDGDSYPSYCSRVRFPSYTSWSGSFLSRLEKYFPSVRDSRDQLWKHEWDKHGTCTTMSPQQYLEKSIEMQREIGTPALLRRNVGGTVRADELMAAYRPAGARSGNWAKLVCRNGGDLHEVRTCYTKDFRRKPCRSSGSCPRTISVVQKSGWPMPKDECDSRAKQSCARQNKADCQPYDTTCGECLIGWKADPRSSRGTCVKEAACNARVSEACAKRHAGPCSEGSAECGPCLPDYMSDGNGKCVGAPSMTISRPRSRSRYSLRSGSITVKWANDRCGTPVLMTLYKDDDQIDDVLEETQRHGSLSFNLPSSLVPGDDYRVYLIADGGAGCEVYSEYFKIDS